MPLIVRFPPRDPPSLSDPVRQALTRAVSDLLTLARRRPAVLFHITTLLRVVAERAKVEAPNVIEEKLDTIAAARIDAVITEALMK